MQLQLSYKFLFIKGQETVAQLEGVGCYNYWVADSSDGLGLAGKCRNTIPMPKHVSADTRNVSAETINEDASQRENRTL